MSTHTLWALCECWKVSKVIRLRRTRTCEHTPDRTVKLLAPPDSVRQSVSKMKRWRHHTAGYLRVLLPPLLLLLLLNLPHAELWPRLFANTLIEHTSERDRYKHTVDTDLQGYKSSGQRKIGSKQITVCCLLAFIHSFTQFVVELIFSLFFSIYWKLCKCGWQRNTVITVWFFANRLEVFVLIDNLFKKYTLKLGSTYLISVQFNSFAQQ